MPALASNIVDGVAEGAAVEDMAGSAPVGDRLPVLLIK